MSDLLQRLRAHYPYGGLPREAAARIEKLEAALRTILANTEEDAIPHIAYDEMTAYQALAKDIADCARAALAKE